MSRRAPRFAVGIVTRLLLWFLVISLVPCGVLTAVISYLSHESVEISVSERLVAISDAKTTQLEDYIRERRGDAAILGQSPGVVEAVVQLGDILGKVGAAAPDYHRLAEQKRVVLSHFVDTYGYENISIFNLDGVPLVSYKPGLDAGPNLLTGPLKGTELADVFVRARMLLQSVLSDYQMYPGRSEPSAFIAGPVLKEGRLVGIVVFEFGNKEVFRAFNDYSALGETGEVLVAMRQGDEVVFVSPTRHDSSASFGRRLRFGSDRETAMQRAVQGQRGHGVAVDYRGQDVVAAWSYLPSFRWGMVVKQDSQEAFRLIHHQRLAVAALLVATVVLVTLVALMLARSLTRPIRAAVEMAKRVAAGDLSAELTETATGESGQLLQAIQKMNQDLRSLIGRIQQSSVELMSTATEIAATSKQQEQTVQAYGASTNEAAAAVNEISATSRQLLNTMNEVNEVAGQTGDMATSGQDGLLGMGRTMRLLADSTGSITAKLSVISERAAHINLAVTTITKVADQTNLLSINAAIEAEKAGEYGLGFLVVAREIRRLADQTAVATLDIERMVKEMQSGVAAGVMEMDKFTEQVRQGVSEVSHIGAQLGQIIEAVHGLTGRFELVTQGMRVQADGAGQILEAVVHIQEAATQTSVSLKEFNRATTHLRDAVSGLKEEVSRFTLCEPQDASTERLPR